MPEHNMCCKACGPCCSVYFSNQPLSHNNVFETWLRSSFHSPCVWSVAVHVAMCLQCVHHKVGSLTEKDNLLVIAQEKVWVLLTAAGAHNRLKGEVCWQRSQQRLDDASSATHSQRSGCRSAHTAAWRCALGCQIKVCTSCITLKLTALNPPSSQQVQHQQNHREASASCPFSLVKRQLVYARVSQDIEYNNIHAL